MAFNFLAENSYLHNRHDIIPYDGKLKPIGFSGPKTNKKYTKTKTRPNLFSYIDFLHQSELNFLLNDTNKVFFCYSLSVLKVLKLLM